MRSISFRRPASVVSIALKTPEEIVIQANPTALPFALNVHGEQCALRAVVEGFRLSAFPA